MKQYIKYLCAFLIFLSASAHVWGATGAISATSTIILPKGNTTNYTSGDWTGAGAPAYSTSNDDVNDITIGGSVIGSVRFYHAGGSGWLQLQKANGYIETVISSTQGVDVVVYMKSAGASGTVTATLTGATSQTVTGITAAEKSLSTTNTSATLKITCKSNAAQIGYIKITPKEKFTVTFHNDYGLSTPSAVTQSTGGAAVTIPSASPSAVCSAAGWEFAGWKDGSYQTSNANYVSGLIYPGSYVPTANKNLYAVFRLVGSAANTTYTCTSTSSASSPFEVSTAAGGFTISLAQGASSNWHKGAAPWRLYADGTTLTVSGCNPITSLAIVHNGTYYGSFTSSVAGSTVTMASSSGGTTNVTNINASSITLTSGGSTQNRIASIKVNYTAYTYRSDPECALCDASPTISGAALNGSFNAGGVTSLANIANVFSCTGSSPGSDCSYNENGFVWSSTASTAGTLQKGSSGVTYIAGTTPNGSGAFTGTLSGSWTAGTTYYYRAYVKNDGDNVTYYPASDVNSFIALSITFNSNGGSAVSTKYVRSGGTITAPADPTKPGYTFAGWYSNSGLTTPVDWSATIGSNKTYYAKWTANDISITLKKNNSDASGSTDGSASVKYDATSLTSISHATRAGYKIEGYYAEAACTNKVITDAGVLVNYSGYVESGKWVRSSATDLYANWTAVTYSDYKFSCAELTLTPVLVTSGTPIFITSTASKKVRSQDYIQITGSGLTPNQTLTFPGLPGIFEIKTATYGDLATDASGAIDVAAYIFYTPAADATSDGLDKITGITVTVEGAKTKTVNLTQDIIGRHLPSQFVIAAKWGGTWYALPADFTKTTSDADCNGIPVAISVDADGSGNPTQAYGPSTLAYAVNMVGSGGTGTATFSSSGKYLYLDMINNSHYALEAAGSGTSVARGSGNAATGDLGANYMWLLDQQTAAASTAAETEYHICNAANTTYPLKLYSTENRWGLYSAGTNVATPALRLIPLSVIEPLELSVLEWGETSIAVKSASVNLSSGYTVTARLGTGEAAAVSSVSKIGDDLYIIRGVGSLLTGSGIGMRSLTITATPAEGTAKQVVLQVPLIISNDAATSPAQYVTYTEKQISSFAAGGTGADKVTEGRNIVKTIDVVVRKGGKLTNESTASGDFADLHIYSGGKVDITQGIKFKNVYLRGGFSWLDNQFDSLPRLKTEGDNITLGTGGKVYYDLCLNSDMYYMMALPVDVPLTSVTNEEGTSTFKAWIKKYNGGARAGKSSDPKWISVTSGSLQRGVGYEVAIKKRNNRPYGILRFPLLSSWSAETDFTPTVTAWGSDDDSVTANNKGWNLVGNPFFTAFHNTNEFGSKIVNYGFKQHGDPWDGTYEWDTEGSSIKFFSIPYRHYDDWHDERAIDAKLEPFFPFGVQVKSTGVLTFKAVNRDLKPSIVRKGIQEREVDVDFLLKDSDGKTDNAGLTIGNAYSELFDSEDMEKTITNGTQYMKVYTMVGEYRTAFNYLPEAAAAQPIPVGYIAPAAGEYTFTLKPSGNYSQVEKVLLTDYQNGQTVDLLTEDYSFETEAGEINTRFALNVKLKAETATDMSAVEGGGIMSFSVYGGDQHLVVRGLPTGADVWIYDATGKLVASWNNVREASLRTDVPAAGVYSVRAVLGSEGVTRRAVVR